MTNNEKIRHLVELKGYKKARRFLTKRTIYKGRVVEARIWLDNPNVVYYVNWVGRTLGVRVLDWT